MNHIDLTNLIPAIALVPLIFMAACFCAWEITRPFKDR